MIKFIAKSMQLQNIVKSLNLTKRFYVSSLIVGEAESGKKTIARYILPDAVMVNGENLHDVLDALMVYDEIIIYNFSKLSNFSLLNFDNKRIIATGLYQPKDKMVDELFGYIYTLPPLRERPEDAKELTKLFFDEAKEVLSMDTETIPDLEELDLSQNCKSLQKSVYKSLILSQMEADDIAKLMYNFFLKNLHGNNDYKEFLPLFEKPMIEAGLHLYKSQLKLASILGINRNTLRKKANEYGL